MMDGEKTGPDRYALENKVVVAGIFKSKRIPGIPGGSDREGV